MLNQLLLFPDSLPAVEDIAWTPTGTESLAVLLLAVRLMSLILGAPVWVLLSAVMSMATFCAALVVLASLSGAGIALAGDMAMGRWISAKHRCRVRVRWK